MDRQVVLLKYQITRPETLQDFTAEHMAKVNILMSWGKML